MITPDVVICGVAIFIATLTLFSGFGMGTLLMPAFALFFPLPVAIAATAIVHLANNLFKVAMLGRKADWSVVVRFALPGMVTAVLGASLLKLFAGLPPLTAYQLGDQVYQITTAKLVIALLIIVFAFFDLLPRLQTLSFDPKYLVLGGALSGFFGGLSGHQGALRSAFLIKSGLEKEEFVGTGVVASTLVDLSRVFTYGLAFYATGFARDESGMAGLVVTAILAAFVGSFTGRRLLRKVALRTVQHIVGGMLILIGMGMMTGMI
jgi:uncharacterized membrane protein YfcA